jgi:hypothetical protein
VIGLVLLPFSFSFIESFLCGLKLNDERNQSVLKWGRVPRGDFSPRGDWGGTKLLPYSVHVDGGREIFN